MLLRATHFIHIHAASAFDIFTLASLAIWQGGEALIAFISTEDWDKITGPNGLVFVLIVGLIVLWMKSARDDSAKERRHKESISTQQVHFKALLDLNEKGSEDLKVLTVASTKAQMTATNAIISMDHNIIRLTNEIADAGKIQQLQLQQLHTDKEK